jgi:ABC-type multidrug transport system ATPase subunit
LGIFGSNGAGKTTLIKIMAGLLRADGGTGQVLGYDVYREHKKIRASVSLVAPTADVGTDNNLTVRQNLEFWAVVYDLEESLRDRRIDELLAFLDLTPYAGAWPATRSSFWKRPQSNWMPLARRPSASSSAHQSRGWHHYSPDHPLYL